MAPLIAIIVVALIVIVTLARTIRIVPQARAAVVERLGRYSRTLSPGLVLVVPFIDRVRPLLDLREQVVSFPPQPVITEDNLVVSIDSVIYFQVTDAKAVVLQRVDDMGGRVKLGGEEWSARSYISGEVFDAGAHVEVAQIEGATALVYR